MCGVFFGYSRKSSLRQHWQSSIDGVAAALRFRGPDGAEVLEGEDWIALHTLLSITGKGQQPSPWRDGVFLYNGEIYNHWERYGPDYGDVDFLRQLLNDQSVAGLDALDGEFALIVLDESAQQLHLVSDCFATKPFYYSLGEDGIAVASYEHILQAIGHAPVVQVPANTHLVIDLDRMSVQRSCFRVEFDFGSANVDSFEPFKEAFTHAIRKRASNLRHPLYVSLSSGHDSGLIAAELEAQSLEFSAYGFEYGEDQTVMTARFERLKAKGWRAEIMSADADALRGMESYLVETLPPYYLVNEEQPEINYGDADFRHVSGYIAGAVIAQVARSRGELVTLSGQGADEIISDYFNPHSNSRRSVFRGAWEKATEPWCNFYGGWNRVYLGGTERISGHFGIETRYPFLDSAAVQAFLNLTPEMKRTRYKGGMAERMDELKYPYHNYKIGFAGFKK